MGFKLFVIILCVIKISHQDLDAVISVNTDKETCTTTYHQCSVKIVGSMSSIGPKGELGKRGDMGSEGHRGDRGITGPPGHPGVCECSDPRKPENFLKSLTSDMKLHSPEDNTICIHYDLVNVTDVTLKRSGVQYENMNKTFWYSEFEFNIETFYGLSIEKLRYIADNSDFVSQKVRYYCQNSFSKRSDIDTFVRFLSWNNVVMGYYPSDFTPSTYVVDTTSDGCKDSSGSRGADWKYTDIELTGSPNLRLPILDLQIRDARSEHQIFHVEPLKLCFTGLPKVEL